MHDYFAHQTPASPGAGSPPGPPPGSSSAPTTSPLAAPEQQTLTQMQGWGNQQVLPWWAKFWQQDLVKPLLEAAPPWMRAVLQLLHLLKGSGVMSDWAEQLQSWWATLWQVTLPGGIAASASSWITSATSLLGGIWAKGAGLLGTWYTNLRKDWLTFWQTDLETDLLSAQAAFVQGPADLLKLIYDTGQNGAGLLQTWWGDLKTWFTSNWQTLFSDLQLPSVSSLWKQVTGQDTTKGVNQPVKSNPTTGSPANGNPANGDINGWRQVIAGQVPTAMQNNPDFINTVLAGAYAESGLDPTKPQPNGNGYGFFQFDTGQGGMGYGLSTQQLSSESFQASQIIPQYAYWWTMAPVGLSGAQKAAWVAAHAERPQDYQDPTSPANQNYMNAWNTVTGSAAAGGPVGGPAWVGENGPELFVPNQPGTVLSDFHLSQVLGTLQSAAVQTTTTVTSPGTQNTYTVNLSQTINGSLTQQEKESIAELTLTAVEQALAKFDSQG